MSTVVLTLNFKRATWIEYEKNVNTELLVVESEDGVHKLIALLPRQYGQQHLRPSPGKKNPQKGMMVRVTV